MDFGFRLRLAGYRISNSPKKSILFHKYKFLKNKRNYYYLHRNRIITYLKLYKNKTYFFFSIPFILLELSFVAHSINKKYVRELLSGYLYIISNYKNILNKRNKINDYRKISDKQFLLALKRTIEFSEANKIWVVNKIINLFLLKYYNIVVKHIN